jgi:hypothetical protein
MMKHLPVFFLLMFLWVVPSRLMGQQNLTMYSLPDNPQVNTLNPAFQNTCKWFVGLPVITSVHANVGNNAMSFKDLFKSSNSTNYISSSILNLVRINALDAEVYIELFNIGYLKKANYYTFSITEKIDLAGFVNKDLITLALDGNTPFEGKTASGKRTGLFMDYRREFAFGISHKVDNETFFGVKGKLLFGKLNVSTRKSKNSFSTDATTFALKGNANLKVNVSAPVEIETDTAGIISNVTYTGNIKDILLNRKNVGLAFDLGFIKKISPKETISGSILDLGGILYHSNTYNYSIDGSYTYTGQLTTSSRHYLANVLDSALATLGGNLTTNSYFVFLPPRLYGDYAYNINNRLKFNATSTIKIYRYKILPSIGVSGTYKVFNQVSLAASWLYTDRTLRNVGVGIVAGRSPVQFYMFTDNILTALNPLNVRNFNLRFGINLIFGCKNNDKTNINKCGCESVRQDIKRKERYRKLRKK